MGGWADENGDRTMDCEFLNVLDAEVWPVVARYDAASGKLRMVGGNITWIGGGRNPVNACSAIPHTLGDCGVVLCSQ